MKNITLLFIALFLTTLIFAQTPQTINYQGVARDLSGNSLANQTISLRMSVISGSPSGTNEYSETHSITTNNLGLFSIQIGGGTILNGAFSTIDWGNSSHFLQTEIDENGGTSYTLTGTTQMLSVPYALYAKKAENGSKWEDNSTGIYYENRGVVIGDTTSIDTSRVSFRSVTPNGGYIDFVGVSSLSSNYNAHQYPRIELNGTTGKRGVITLWDYIANETTMQFGFNQNLGNAHHFNFRSNGSNHLTIAGNGNVGLSTGQVSLPKTKLHVKGGDVYVDDIASGIILTSPNGNCWRVTIDNTGNLIRTAITCP